MRGWKGKADPNRPEVQAELARKREAERLMAGSQGDDTDDWGENFNVGTYFSRFRTSDGRPADGRKLKLPKALGSAIAVPIGMLVVILVMMLLKLFFPGTSP